MALQISNFRYTMVLAWYMDAIPGDQRLPHKPDNGETVSLEMLAPLGVLYWKLNTDVENNPELEKIRTERGYNYQDVITVSPEKLPNYEQKIKVFFEEHLHTEEEIRFILEGSGYFDVRDKQDRWIRIEVVEGDLLVLPAGIYHRFTLDTKDYIKAMRLFQGVPVWTPVNRPADDNPARVNYVTKYN